MIEIGLAGWGDHTDLYAEGTGGRSKLEMYSGYFPTVEVDTSFYAIQPPRNYEKWCAETPKGFTFLVKAYQGMTGHLRGPSLHASEEDMYREFLESIEPLQKAGKLKAVLFQYPPWFKCEKSSVDILREARRRMGDVPVALEFRHQSWFVPGMREKTLAFMRGEGWIHSICDEPQAGEGSIPMVLEPTHPDVSVVRFHGRNEKGWNQTPGQNWREVRYLYRYNEAELLEWRDRLLALQEQTKDIVVIFNNNSGGDAADNGRELIRMLDLQYENLAPRQLDLF